MDLEQTAGRPLIGRRTALATLGATALWVRAGAVPAVGTPHAVVPAGTTTLKPADFAGAGSCGVLPTSTAGPFTTHSERDLQDIRGGRPGRRLRVGLRVLGKDCKPIKGAVVHIWHCDADGDYSEYLDGSGGDDGGPDTHYLRGSQTTNADGICEFVTIYPGWYPGRTVHIHGQVRIGGKVSLVTQFYFDDVYTDGVFKAAPYVGRGPRDTRNADDGIAGTVMKTTNDGTGSLALLNVGVNAVAPAERAFMVSTRADRSRPVRLEGATVKGKVAIFLGPARTAIPNLSSVIMYLDGVRVRTDTTAPYDLRGGGATALLTDTARLKVGRHRVGAVVNLKSGRQIVYRASFIVRR